MSDDSDFIQANLLRHAERERIRKALEPDGRIKSTSKHSLWFWLGLVAFVACVMGFAWFR